MGEGRGKVNDFTKEELYGLYECCKAAYMSGKINPRITLKIEEKIQSMIDNYCETTLPTMASYCYSKCNNEWLKCECRK